MIGLVEIVIYTSIYIGLIATTFYVLSFISYREGKELLFEDNELPKVSVLIPIYNEEGSVKKTLDSILITDYPKNKFEIIVIDDGSTDNSLKIAKTFEKKGVKIFAKKVNGGKGSALNYGLKKCKGEVFISMDADTMIEPQTVKNMIRYFKDKEVMSVTPAITTYKPTGILQRVQHAEYLLGLFLRKAFASVNAIHITPGAFSAYRKSFTDKYGGYDEDNITEDLELSMRIQYHNYKIENSPIAPAYTIPPRRFSHLLKQRRRWYVGLMRNMWKFKKMFGSKYGDLGLFVLPVAWIMIFFSVFSLTCLFFKTLFNVKKEILFLNSVSFDFVNVYDFNLYFFETVFFRLFSNPIIIFFLFFVAIFGFYLHYASKKLGKQVGLVINLPLFFIFFALLFGFWWVISIIYVVLNRKVSWK